ncbi:MAG: S8 family serine peptidase [Bacteroidales bacterium]|nr:S8 family serine peptidase [Bacteroidales bacterium]
MKKLLIYLSFLLNSCIGIFSQETPNFYYYYKGEKLNLSVRQDQFILYLTSDISDVSESLTSDLGIVPIFKSEQEFVYRIHTLDKDFFEIVNGFRSIKEVKSIEYIVGDTIPIMVSNLFHIQLNDASDYSKLEEIAEITNSTILVEKEKFLNWYTLRNDNKLLSSIEVSNFFWETGLFKEVDPGFVFNFKFNTLTNSCVSDAKFETEQWNMPMINACEAWDITTGDNSIKVAIIDGGVKEEHQEFSILNVFDRYNFSDNTNQFIDGLHGTLVGGIIFANHNSYNIAGIAPNVTLINFRVNIAESDSYTSSELAEAITRAVDLGAKVINNSWGDQNYKYYYLLKSAILESAIDYAINNDVLLVFASGNFGENTNHRIDYPGNSREEILVVGSTNRDMSRSSFSSYGNELNVVAPGSDIYTTSNAIGNQYKIESGTSLAAPHVAGIAALMLSVNPELTSIQVKNIIEQTAKKIGNYSYNNSSAHPNGPWNNQVGYGLVDAYAAVRASLDVDLYTRDNNSDSGTEPLVNLLDGFNDSPDIWLRREPDGGTTHQLGRQGEENYVYIRVHNRGENTSFGRDVVKLYIKRAGIGTNVWNEDWTMIGETFIPQIPSGESVVVRIDAEFPTYNNFEWSQNLPDVSYALLTRIESDFDDVTYTEFENTGMNVIQNNNISCKNVVMTNAVLLDDVITDVAIAGINNSTDEMLFTSLKFSSPINEYGNPLSSEAEIRIIFPIELVELWESFDKIGLEHINDTTFRVIEDNAMLENICIPKKYDGLVKIQINFLTEEYSEKDKFEYVVEQYVPGSEELQNRLTILVDKNQRDKLFKAEGGEDVIVKENTIITLSAEDIGENAVYNWYNTSGKFVDRGQNISVTALGTEKYTLEVIAKADGYKDYDSVYVVTTLGKIESISPNPANEQAIVTYDLSSSVSNAYIAIINYSGVLVYNSEIDVLATTHTLNLQNLVAGQYNVRLVSAAGEVMDTKTLIVQ